MITLYAVYYEENHKGKGRGFYEENHSLKRGRKNVGNPWGTGYSLFIAIRSLCKIRSVSSTLFLNVFIKKERQQLSLPFLLVSYLIS